MQNNQIVKSWAKTMLNNWCNRSALNKNFNQSQNKTLIKTPSQMAVAIILAHADIEINLGEKLTGLKISPVKINSDKIRNILSINEANICDFMIIWDNQKSAVMNIIYDKKSYLH